MVARAPRSRVFLLAAALLAPASAATAQNVLQNPEFDGFFYGEFPGWTKQGVNAKAGDDADACPNSDSYRIEANSEKAGFKSEDCLQGLESGDRVFFEIAYRSEAPIDLRLDEYDGPNCTLPQLSTPPDPMVPASEEWTILRLDETITNLSTHSARLWVRVDADFAYVAEFDRAYFGLEERIFADDFDGNDEETICRWDVIVDGQPL